LTKFIANQTIKMKKLSLLLIFAVGIMMISCGGDDATETTTDENTEEVADHECCSDDCADDCEIHADEKKNCEKPCCSDDKKCDMSKCDTTKKCDPATCHKDGEMCGDGDHCEAGDVDEEIIDEITD
jgi:hypothetical protein